MSFEERLEALKDFAKSQDWGEVTTYSGSQREPGFGIVIHDVPGIGRLSFESHDSQAIALAKCEQFLTAMKRAGSHVYLHAPHNYMGRIV